MSGFHSSFKDFANFGQLLVPCRVCSIVQCCVCLANDPTGQRAPRQIFVRHDSYKYKPENDSATITITTTKMSRLSLVFVVGVLCFGAGQLPMATATCCPVNGLLDLLYYIVHPNCNPAKVKESVTCASLPTWVPITGGLYGDWSQHYNVMGSRYYFARMAEALGLPCPTDLDQMKNMDLITPWSAIFGAIAVDGARSGPGNRGFDRLILRRCDFPVWQADNPEQIGQPVWPFLCRGSAGNPGTCGAELGTLSYNSILHDDVNHRWNVFAHCWNAKSPQSPNAQETAVSFNVFSLDKVLSATDRQAIIDRLNSLGFDTSSSNLIEPDFSS